MEKNKKKLKKSYDLAKSKKVGEEMECPSCKHIFIKKSYQQTFCGRFGRKCNDNYWNNIDHRKFNNTTRISPANRASTEIWLEDRYDNSYSVYDYCEDEHPFSSDALGQS